MTLKNDDGVETEQRNLGMKVSKYLRGTNDAGKTQWRAIINCTNYTSTFTEQHKLDLYVVLTKPIEEYESTKFGLQMNYIVFTASIDYFRVQTNGTVNNVYKQTLEQYFHFL